MNDYFTPSGAPATSSPGDSAQMRSEFNSISTAFDKMPVLTGSALRFIRVNASGTALEAVASPAFTGGTIDDAAINLDGGSLVLPLGTAAAPTAEGQVYWNSTTNKLTIGDGAAALQMVDLASAQTLTGKTISGASNTLSAIANASLVNSALTIGSTAISLGATAATLAGLTSVAATTFTGALTGAASLNVLKTGDTMTGNLTINTGADSRINLQSSGTTQGILQATGTHLRMASPNALPLVLATAGVDRLTVDSAGAITMQAGAGSTPLQLFGTSDPLIIGRFVASAAGPFIITRKSRSGSYGGQGIVSANDGLGGFFFTASDGVGFIPAGSMHCEIDGTPGVNDMPGRLIFTTTPDGSATQLERMRINNVGNVGIGATPAHRLDVQSSAATIVRLKGGAGAAQGAALYITEAGTASTLAAFGDRATIFGSTPDQVVSLYTNANIPLLFDVGGAERMRIDGAGNVGIGRDTPSTFGRFVVASTGTPGAAYASILSGVNVYGNAWESTLYLGLARTDVVNNGATAGFRIKNFGAGATGSYLAFEAGSSAAGINAPPATYTERMRIDNAGNVGIGGTAPAGVRLRIADSGTTQIMVQETTGSVDTRIVSFGGSLGLVGTYSNHALALTTNATEKLRISADGRMGLGVGASNDMSFRVNRAIDGATSAFGMVVDSTVQSGVTNTAVAVRTSVGTQAAAFTIGNLFHFQAAQAGLGAGSAVTAQIGFLADATLTGATNNYGFRGTIAAAASRWNVFMDGSAANYFAGNTSIGAVLTTFPLAVQGNVSDTDGTGLDQGQLFLYDAVDSSGLQLGYRYQVGVSEYGRIQARNSTGATNLLIQPGGGNTVIGPNRLTVASTGLVSVTPAAGTVGMQINSSVDPLIITNHSVGATGPFITTRKSRNATYNGQGLVSNGDFLGGLWFTASDGVGFQPAANIMCQIDGTPGVGDMPGRLIFSTTPDGAAASVERLRIDSTGRLAINHTFPTAVVDVRGSRDVTDGGTVIAGIASALTGVSGSATSLQGFTTFLSPGTGTALTELIHYGTGQRAFVGTAALQIGFDVTSALTSATTNYGFRGRIASGTNRWNLYMDGTADNFIAGRIGFGSPATDAGIRAGRNIDGGTLAHGIVVDGAIQSGVTSFGYGVRTVMQTQAAAFTLQNMYHFGALQGTFGAGSTVVTQNGFYVSSNLVGGTNNYAFRSELPSGTGRYNLYMNGTAENYLNGRTGIRNFPQPSTTLTLGGNIDGATSAFSLNANGLILSSVTTQAVIYNSAPATQAASFTLQDLAHFRADTASFGAGSSVTTQTGFDATANLSNATNNYGFRGQIANNTNRWNLYMDGTARNYLAGNTSIGTTDLSSAPLRVRAPNLAGDPAILAENANTTAAYPVMRVVHAATTGNNLLLTFDTDGIPVGTQRGTIDYNRAGGLIRYNTTSDYRAKDVLGPVLGAVETISLMNPITGLMKGGTLPRPMFVAHELAEVAPYAVSGEKDAVDEDGEPIYQGVDAGTLVPLLVAAVQELTARIRALEANR